MEVSRFYSKNYVDAGQSKISVPEDARGSEVYDKLEGVVDSARNEAATFQAKLDESLAGIRAESQKVRDEFTNLANEVRTGYNDQMIDVKAAVKPLQDSIATNIDRMTQSYNTQIAQQAEQVDALQASGQLGNNAYRAYQIQTQANRDIVGQAMGQIAQFSQTANAQLVEFGLQASGQNQALFSNTMNTLANLASSQADAALGYAQVYNSTLINGQQALNQLQQLSISALNAQLDYITDQRKIDAAIKQANQQAKLQQQQIDNQNRGPFFVSVTYS